MGLTERDPVIGVDALTTPVPDAIPSVSKTSFGLHSERTPDPLAATGTSRQRGFESIEAVLRVTVGRTSS